MRLAYERKLEKSGSVSSRTQSLPLGTEGGSISGTTFGAVRRHLSSSFPSLFSLALNKEAKVADIWESREGAGCWSPTFIRPLNDWELEEMIRFLQTLHDQNFRPTGEDKLLLKNVKEKGFSVKIMYKGLILPMSWISHTAWRGIQLFPKKLESLLGKLLGVKCTH